MAQRFFPPDPSALAARAFRSRVLHEHLASTHRRWGWLASLVGQTSGTEYHQAIARGYQHIADTCDEPTWCERRLAEFGRFTELMAVHGWTPPPAVVESYLARVSGVGETRLH